MARPRIDIDKATFEKLCGLQCTKADIAGWFEVSEDTIDRFCKREYKASFAVVFAQKRSKGIISLRKAGFDMAKTVPSVHIFYAKNYLGMTDKIEQTITEVEDLSTLAEMLKDEQEADNRVETVLCQA